MTRKSLNEYPIRDLIPEHTKRRSGKGCPLHPEVMVAYKYVESISDTSDYRQVLTWHGWALREAFLAGISYERENK